MIMTSVYFIWVPCPAFLEGFLVWFGIFFHVEFCGKASSFFFLVGWLWFFFSFPSPPLLGPINPSRKIVFSLPPQPLTWNCFAFDGPYQWSKAHQQNMEQYQATSSGRILLKTGFCFIISTSLPKMLKLLEVVTAQPRLVAVFVLFLIGAHQLMYLTEVFTCPGALFMHLAHQRALEWYWLIPFLLIAKISLPWVRYQANQL